jgi:hypothetical protein
MNKTVNLIKGECLCGNVKFEVQPPVKWCSNCHCTRCQRSHGAGFVTWFGVYKDKFKLIAGDTYLKWYDSSKRSKYGFCKNCGSSMFFKSSKWKDEIHMTLANVYKDIGVRPTDNLYFDTHVDWLTFDDGLKRFDDPNIPK